MTKKLIMILGLVLSSMLMKAQAFFVPFPKAGDKYWQKQVPVAMRNDYIQLGNLYQKKLENMGRFITTMYINDLTFVNFSDAQAQNVPNINILFPYGAYLQNEQMMQLEVYVAKKYLYMQKPSELYRK
ncbi:hypothetical protein ONT15_08015 [Prevotella copri]|uniref:Uncharacterized protein n=1 Tax=Segatella copri TaxID=165179 RepID=A0AAW5U8U9_9BACT|nr:hypothetical protein [Segatella copri]MCW4099353.1 hypothetical protein [Segatella copri]MCW4132126.1 hypothetical protein [Segatella copri]MCW4160666.1 hypothetical protein [Segatella copri]